MKAISKAVVKGAHRSLATLKAGTKHHAGLHRIPNVIIQSPVFDESMSLVSQTCELCESAERRRTTSRDQIETALRGSVTKSEEAMKLLHTVYLKVLSDRGSPDAS